MDGMIAPPRRLLREPDDRHAWLNDARTIKLQWLKSRAGRIHSERIPKKVNAAICRRIRG